MALMAWFPLTKDMHNYGVSDVTLTTSTAPTFAAEGKLGGSLCAGGTSTVSAEQNAKIMNNDAISVCFWVYVDAPEGDKNKRAMFFGNNERRQYSIFQYPTCNDLHWSWYSYDAEGNGTASASNILYGVLPSYQWTHVAVTYADKISTIYINGEEAYVAENRVINNYSYEFETTYIYGCNYRKLCDFRVYNNGLTANEVKKISQALVFHMPLTSEGVGNENIIRESQTFRSGGDGWYIHSDWKYSVDDEGFAVLSCARTGATTSIWNRIYPLRYIQAAEFPKGVTVSFDLKVDDFSALDSLNAKRIIAVNTYNASDTRVGYKEDFYLDTLERSGDMVDGEWIRYWTYLPESVFATANTSPTTVPDRTITYASITFQLVRNGSIHIRKIKYEFGDTVTPWCPNKEDDINWGISTAHDISGYGHNGIKTDIATVLDDTPRYLESTSFNGDTSMIKFTDLNLHPLLNGDFTISFWVKSNDAGQRSMYFSGYGFTTYKAFMIDKQVNERIRIYWGGAPDIGTTMVIPDNEWAFITIVRNQSNLKGYVNGVLYYNRDHDFDIANLDPNTIYGIGCDSRPGTIAYNGLMSDFRIYTTALSEDDILELYNERR